MFVSSLLLFTGGMFVESTFELNQLVKSSSTSPGFLIETKGSSVEHHQCHTAGVDALQLITRRSRTTLAMLIGMGSTQSGPEDGRKLSSPGERSKPSERSDQCLAGGCIHYN